MSCCSHGRAQARKRTAKTMELGNRAFLDTRQSSQFLWECGFKVAPATLDTKRSRGGGPKFRRLGPRVVYERQELLDWAHKSLSPPFANTAEASVPVAENGCGRPRKDIWKSPEVWAAIAKAVEDAVAREMVAAGRQDGKAA